MYEPMVRYSVGTKISQSGTKPLESNPSLTSLSKFALVTDPGSSITLESETAVTLPDEYPESFFSNKRVLRLRNIRLRKIKL